MLAGLPLHPLIVHAPLVLALLVPIVLLVVTLRGRREGAGRGGWLVAGALQIALVGTGLLALRTGQADEERVERRVPEAALEAHEEAAELFLGGAAGALALTLGGLALGRRGTPWAGGLVTVAAVVVAGLAVRTGHAGGQLVYRYGAAAAWAQPEAASAGAGPAARPAGRAERDGDDD